MEEGYIFFVGFMGAGKTSVAKKVAAKMGLPFQDSDQELEKRHAMTVNQIFDEKGESFFRGQETLFLESLDRNSSGIVSVGGGLPCFNNNMDQMKSLGIVVYLKHPVGQLVNRLIHAKKTRPLIREKSEQELKEYIAEMMRIRSPFYEQAHLIVSGNEIHPGKIVELIRTYTR